MHNEIKKQGGQTVIMGIMTNSPLSTFIINKLKKKSKKNEEKLKVYTEIKQQLDHIEGTDLQIGKLIRFASDFTMVPSYKEACGLVPMEALCSGSLVITSQVQGLKDTCRGKNQYGEDKFNAFTYSNSLNPLSTYNAAQQAIQNAFKFYKNTSETERNKIVGRLINTADQYDWILALKNYDAAYGKAISQKPASDMN